jgi:hypothetical protein
MPVRAVIFDIGGVLEKAGPPLSWLGPWLEELSLTADDLRNTIEHAAPAGQIETGALTEPQYRSQIAAALGLTPGQERRFFTGMWDWYCGELDTELAAFAASLRPRCRTAILARLPLLEHLIRSSGQVVQDRLGVSALWTDVPGLSTRDRRCLAVWQQWPASRTRPDVVAVHGAAG